MAKEVYQPLQSDEVRFLRLLPGRQIAAELNTYPLHQVGPYIALSYTWGDAPCKSESINALYEIILNNHIVKIQENLYHALTYLAPKVRNKNCLLWIDAVCINQNDVKERNAQILHMAYIYKHAFAICGWIGVPHDEEEVRLAVALMKKTHIFLRDGLAEHDGDMKKVSTSITPENEDIIPGAPDSDSYRGWLGIKEIIQRPYWRRTWIYQEATVTDDTIFFCGDEHFTLTLVSATICMAHHVAEYSQSPVGFRCVAISAPFSMASFRLNGVIQCDHTLLELLEYLRYTECSEPRDKVYAILGMAADSSPRSIFPDYSKSLVDVYIDVVKFSLSQADHGLRVLGHVTHPAKHWTTPSQIPGFPSWVPDYRTHGGLNPFCTKLADSTWLYKACGAKKTHHAMIDDLRLVVKGQHIDQIVSVSAIWEDDTFSTAEVQAWAPESPDALYTSSGQTRDESFRTTVFADMDASTGSRGFVADWTLMDADVHTLTSEESWRRYQMNIALNSASGGRRFCWTKFGRMGLAPAAAQTGDLLYVLWGGQMVHVLRRNEVDSYTYIGECYLHGVMNGELVVDEVAANEHEQTLVLE